MGKIINIPDCADEDKIDRINSFIKEVFAEPEKKVYQDYTNSSILENSILEKEQPRTYLDSGSGDKVKVDSRIARHIRHQQQWDKRSLPRKLAGIWRREHRPLTGNLKLNLFKRSTGGKSKRKNKRCLKKNKKRTFKKTLKTTF
jgi:hypothetical protein